MSGVVWPLRWPLLPTGHACAVRALRLRGRVDPPPGSSEPHFFQHAQALPGDGVRLYGTGTSGRKHNGWHNRACALVRIQCKSWFGYCVGHQCLCTSRQRMMPDGRRHPFRPRTQLELDQQRSPAMHGCAAVDTTWYRDFMRLCARLGTRSSVTKLG